MFNNLVWTSAHHNCFLNQDFKKNSTVTLFEVRGLTRCLRTGWWEEGARVSWKLHAKCALWAGAGGEITVLTQDTQPSGEDQKSPPILKWAHESERSTQGNYPGSKINSTFTWRTQSHLFPPRTKHMSLSQHTAVNESSPCFMKDSCFWQRMKSGQARTRGMKRLWLWTIPWGTWWAARGPAAWGLRLGPRSGSQLCICTGRWPARWARVRLVAPVCSVWGSVTRGPAHWSQTSRPRPAGPRARRSRRGCSRIPWGQWRGSSGSLGRCSKPARLQGTSLERSLRKLFSPHAPAAAAKESTWCWPSAPDKSQDLPRAGGTRLRRQPTCCAQTLVSRPLSILTETVPLELIPQASPRRDEAIMCISREQRTKIQGSERKGQTRTWMRTRQVHVSDTDLSVFFFYYFWMFVDALFSHHKKDSVPYLDTLLNST